ncbi:hypothetical protein BDN72DRAFT_905191 [Pluteus cervinus]|uniref:Uncharacterized protein n=1 Tax=Pluteus cervinus TaxID=181527 RepID=A0ACD3A2X6_9AGAR|nr:hypothetical protein BDN72DRAFT_905191 [Pluteus cervinus]
MSNRKLPQRNRRAMWTVEAGLVTCVSSLLPATVNDDPKSRDFAKPRRLHDTQIYMGFFPRSHVYASPLLSKVGLSDSRLIEEIHHVPEFGYYLSTEVRRSWARVENFLERIAESLIAGARTPEWSKRLYGATNVQIPLVDPPRNPRHYRYRNFHPTHRCAFLHARWARDAFQLLTAYVSFAISLWLGEDEDSSLDLAFEYLSSLREDVVETYMLDILRESIVCDFSLGLRPGFFVSGYDTQWGGFFAHFTRAGIPIWIIWGTDDKHSLSPLDPFMKVEYFPPPDHVVKAKMIASAVAGIRLPTSTLPRGDSADSIDNYIVPRFAGVECPAPPQGFSLEPPPKLTVPPSSLVDIETGQIPGEHYTDFFQRMQEGLERRKRTETDEERLHREAAEIRVQAPGYIPRSGVYKWERVSKNSPFFRRVFVLPSQIEDDWKESTPNQRRYWSQLEQWDICSELPAHGPGEQEVDMFTQFDRESQDPDYNSDLEGDDLPLVDDRPTSPLQIHDIFPPPPPTISLLPSVDVHTYLLTRHGYDSSQDTWEGRLHSPKPALQLQVGDYPKTLQHLCLAAFDAQNPPPTTTESRSVVNFWNVTTAVTNKTRYRELRRGVWDFHSSVDFRKHNLVVLKGKTLEGNKPLWIITRDKNNLNTDGWSIATTSATAVLLAFRRCSSVFDIARLFLDRGIPFFTVMAERHRQVRGIRGWYRKPGFIGRRPSIQEATAGDYILYTNARDKILQSAIGRAARLRAGIVGRIARETVPDVRVLDGPAIGDCVVGRYNNFDLIDDGITDAQLDIICGMFEGLKGAGSHPAHESFWPRQSVWSQTIGVAGDEWLPLAEIWYQEIAQTFADGKYPLLNSRTWKIGHKGDNSKNTAIVRGSETLASDFLQNSSRSPLNSYR